MNTPNERDQELVRSMVEKMKNAKEIDQTRPEPDVTRPKFTIEPDRRKKYDELEEKELSLQQLVYSIEMEIREVDGSGGERKNSKLIKLLLLRSFVNNEDYLQLLSNEMEEAPKTNIQLSCCTSDIFQQALFSITNEALFEITERLVDEIEGKGLDGYQSDLKDCLSNVVKLMDLVTIASSYLNDVFGRTRSNAPEIDDIERERRWLIEEALNANDKEEFSNNGDGGIAVLEGTGDGRDKNDGYWNFDSFGFDTSFIEGSSDEARAGRAVDIEVLNSDAGKFKSPFNPQGEVAKNDSKDDTQWMRDAFGA